ncbi:hypothetical protein FHS85_004900 [Rhodoligotrophos appendicifer]|uniref:hypothetical protein n=1 Tax=Rhodoligotrophos appendicifer TaxID=987056 RepID=UPI0014791C59|nr:hypothetical protein [Rhodoligotrophos appendicifer]
MTDHEEWREKRIDRRDIICAWLFVAIFLGMLFLVDTVTFGVMPVSPASPIVAEQ